MKINYAGKRLLALTLSTAMVMNCGISVFAAETQSETEIVISIPEPEKTIDSFEDYSIDDDGNTIITTTTITEGQDESSSYYEDESSSALIDVKGDLIEESVVVKGNQTYEGEVEADITIKFENMEEGETVSNSSEERETVVGDLKENETDKKYDQTTIIETPKEVEGTLEKVDITRGNGDVEYSDKIENVYDSLKPTDEETKLFGTDKFISNIGLVIGNKVKEHENNADADDTNDAYNVDMTFALAVTVTENDDLIVKVVDSEGKVVRTVRLAGDDSTTNYGTIKPDENGDYVIKGLQLVEGANAFNMKLEGAQHLKEGVYIYTSQDGEEDAEPEFVEVEEGYQIVDLNANVEFNFNVNDGTKKLSRIWANEWYEYNEPETDPEPETDSEIETETETETEIETSRPSYSYQDPVDEELVEIEDEEVPLADAPETGSIAAVCLAAAAVSGLGFTALTLKDKKEDEE